MDEYRCLVSVVGYVSHGRSFTNSKNGVGKSCLCCRFTHPSVDDYVDDHPSLLALHELESSVVCTDSFLYWGSREIPFHTTGKGKGAKVKMEVVEHTLFYHDETSTVFPRFTKLQDVEIYTKQALSPPESSRKISYYSRDCIGFPDRYPCQSYPSNVNRIARGFVVVIDVSVKMPRFKEHLSATQQIVHRLSKDSKHPLIVAATKRDVADSESLQMLVDWASKKKITIIETSAKENINVDGVFSHVASKILKSAKLPDNVLSYSNAAGVSLEESTRVRTQFKRYLKQSVRSSSTMLSSVENNAAYLQTVKLFGKFKADEMYACHLLEMRDLEVKGYPGALDNPDMRMEMLEQFVEDIMLDLVAHKRTLRSLISVIVSPREDLYVNEGRLSNLTASRVQRHHSPKPPAKHPAKIPDYETTSSSKEELEKNEHDAIVNEDERKPRQEVKSEDCNSQFKGGQTSQVSASFTSLEKKPNKEVPEQKDGASLTTISQSQSESAGPSVSKDVAISDKEKQHDSPTTQLKVVWTHPPTGSSNTNHHVTQTDPQLPNAKQREEKKSPFTLVTIIPKHEGCEIVQEEKTLARGVSKKSTRRTPPPPPTSPPASISTQKQVNDCQSSTAATQNCTQATAANEKPETSKTTSLKQEKQQMTVPLPEKQKARLTGKPEGDIASAGEKPSLPNGTSPNPENYQDTVPAAEKPRTKPKPIKPKPNIPKKPSNSRNDTKQMVTPIQNDQTVIPVSDVYDDSCEEIYVSSSADLPEDDVKLEQPTHQTSLPLLENLSTVSGKDVAIEEISLNMQKDEKAELNDQTGVSSEPEKDTVQCNSKRVGETGKAMSEDLKSSKPKLEALRKKVERDRQEKEKQLGMQLHESDSVFSSQFCSEPIPSDVNLSPSKSESVSPKSAKYHSSHSVDSGTETLLPPERKSYDSHTLPSQMGKRDRNRDKFSAPPPPLPPRTNEMAEFVSTEMTNSDKQPVERRRIRLKSEILGDSCLLPSAESMSPLQSTSLGRRKNYFDTIVKKLTKKEKDAQDKDKEKAPKPKFVRMKNRPLPDAPHSSFDWSPAHTSDDYEPVDQQLYPAPYLHVPHIAYPQQFTHPHVQPFDPCPYYPVMEQNVLSPDPMCPPRQNPLAMIRSFTHSESFHQELRRPGRSQSVQYRPHHYVNGETDEYGYEKTDDWFPQPLAFMLPPRAVHPTYADEYDYDYPDVRRGIRNPVLTCPPISGSLPPRKVKPRAQTPPLDEDVDEYMNLQGEPMDDDDYENAEVINMLRMGRSFDDSDISSLRKIIRHGSMDDIHLHTYYNLEILEEPQINDRPSKETVDVSLDQSVTKSADSNHKTDVTEKWNDSIDEETGQTSTSPNNETIKKMIKTPKPLPPRNKPRPNYKPTTGEGYLVVQN